MPSIPRYAPSPCSPPSLDIGAWSLVIGHSPPAAAVPLPPPAKLIPHSPNAIARKSYIRNPPSSICRPFPPRLVIGHRLTIIYHSRFLVTPDNTTDFCHTSIHSNPQFSRTKPPTPQTKQTILSPKIK